jgi:hypothetical protein
VRVCACVCVCVCHRFVRAQPFGITDSTLRAFLLQLHMAYLPNPYHNFVHAFDVTHAMFVTLVAFDARKCLRPIDVFSLMIAAISHDVGHPGRACVQAL